MSQSLITLCRKQYINKTDKNVPKITQTYVISKKPRNKSSSPNSCNTLYFWGDRKWGKRSLLLLLFVSFIGFALQNDICSEKLGLENILKTFMKGFFLFSFKPICLLLSLSINRCLYILYILIISCARVADCIRLNELKHANETCMNEITTT